MSKTYKITLGILVLLLLLLTYFEANEPEEVNWNPSYSRLDKIPLGSHVLFENLKDQDFQIEEINLPPFEFLQDSTKQGTYFFLNNQLAFDDAELKILFNWIGDGNTAFLIAENFSQNLLDSLNLEMKTATPTEGISSKPLLNLSAKELEAPDAFLYDRETYLQVFSKNDSLNQDVLGVAQLRKDADIITAPEINFLRDSIGKGAIYLHSFPKAFSNYFLLEENGVEYTARALAYVPGQKRLFWDRYYKAGKSFNTSPLFIILNSKPLRWAYYFIIIGSILYVLFEGKRKQRSIAVVEPLRNQTFDFTRTVAGLHLDRKDYKGITSKKIALFLDYVRTRYRIEAANPKDSNEEFYRRLAALSGNSEKEVEQLWRHMAGLQENPGISKEDLLQLNRGINNFKRRKNGK